MGPHVARDWNHVTRLNSVTAFLSRSHVAPGVSFGPDLNSYSVDPTQIVRFASKDQNESLKSVERASRDPPDDP